MKFNACCKYVSKKVLLCVILESILADSEALSQLCMPLIVSNAIPDSDIRIFTNDNDQACIIGFWESCTPMNTVNLLVHQCFITQHLHLVETYQNFYTRNAFEPIKLDCAVDNDALTENE